LVYSHHQFEGRLLFAALTFRCQARYPIYLTPVPAGSRLRGRVSILEAQDVPPNALRVIYKVAIEIEGGERPACVAEVIGQHYR
jgi:hypothetical protein